jgi:hypothetical protein
VQLLNLSKHYTCRGGHLTTTKKKMAGDFGHRPFSVAGRRTLPTTDKIIFPAFYDGKIRTFFEV